MMISKTSWCNILTLLEHDICVHRSDFECLVWDWELGLEWCRAVYRGGWWPLTEATFRIRIWFEFSFWMCFKFLSFSFFFSFSAGVSFDVYQIDTYYLGYFHVLRTFNHFSRKKVKCLLCYGCNWYSTWWQPAFHARINISTIDGSNLDGSLMYLVVSISVQRDGQMAFGQLDLEVMMYAFLGSFWGNRRDDLGQGL